MCVCTTVSVRAHRHPVHASYMVRAAIGHHTRCTVHNAHQIHSLLNGDGAVVAYAATDALRMNYTTDIATATTAAASTTSPSRAVAQQHTVRDAAAIAASVWSSYERLGRASVMRGSVMRAATITATMRESAATSGGSRTLGSSTTNAGGEGDAGYVNVCVRACVCALVCL